MYRTNIPKSSGIYLILSKETDRKYVGSSIDLAGRKRVHFKELSKGTHGNSYLQNHANKYGADDLKFGIIELCPKANLIEREQYYIDSIQSKFNICPTANSRLGVTLTEETKKKMSEAHKGQIGWNKGRTMSEEAKKKMSAAKKGQLPWMAGRKHTEESKKKISAAMEGQVSWNKGIPMSEEQKKKLSDAHKGLPSTCGMLGKKHSEESKRKMSESHRKRLLQEERYETNL